MRIAELTLYQQSLITSYYLKSQKAWILDLENKLLSKSISYEDVETAVSTMKADRKMIEHLLEVCGIPH